MTGRKRRRSRLVQAAAFFILAVAVIIGGCSDDADLPPKPDPGPDPDSTTLYTYNVINEYPHDPMAFTQGLVWDGSTLYEGTGTYLSSPSSLRRVVLTTGQVILSRSMPASFSGGPYFGEGIAVFRDRIRQLTWQHHVGFIWERDAFDSLGQFTYPTEGWGLTHDGTRFIMSTGSSFLYFRDTLSFSLIDSIRVHDSAGAVVNLNELEYIDGQVWANIWYSDSIARIDPATGWVEGYVDLSGLYTPPIGQSEAVLNGIAYDAVNDRIFVTGKLWPKLFEIEVVEVE